MATMISTKAFLPYVLPKASGVSVLTAEFQIRLAAIEFCERARCWRHLIEQTVTTDEPVIVCPDYAAVHAIERAQFTIAGQDEPQALTAVPFVDLPPGWRTDSAAPPDCVSQINPSAVVLYPFSPGKLTMSVFLKPREGQDYVRSGQPMTDYFNQVPDFLAHQHAEAIGAGALARILSIQKRPYSDVKMAAVYAATFSAACDRNFDTSRKGQQRAPRRVRYNDF